MIIKIIDDKGFVKMTVSVKSNDVDSIIHLLDCTAEYPVEEYTYRVVKE